MEKETRELIIPVRVTFNEKNKIKSRAKRVEKNMSEFIRDSAIRL